MKYVKKRKLKILHLNANFCCFIICDLSLLLPEPVTLCSTRIHDLRGVQIILILLNPRSHSAVLTGSVWIAQKSLLIFLPETSTPFISLKSLCSCFKSLVHGNKNLLHASVCSFSPYSDETVKGQEVGNKVLTHSIVGLSDSGISRAEWNQPELDRIGICLFLCLPTAI